MYYVRVLILLFLLCGAVQPSKVWAEGRLQLPLSAVTLGRTSDNVLPDTTIRQNADAFKRAWHRKINKLDKQIAKAQRKLQRKGEAGKDNLDKQVNALKEKRDELQQQVDEAGDKTAAEWKDFKDGVAQKYDKLESGVKDLFGH